MKVGFIGLGNLGKALAERLSAEGVKLLVWNRTIEKAEGLDVEVASSAAEVAEKCSTIVLNLFDTAAVMDVLTDEEGLLTGGMEGKTLIDTTTNHYSEVLEVHHIAEQVGFKYLEAPVLGSVMPAKKGLLTVLISGDMKEYKKNRELIGKFGANQFFLEEPGLASRMKVINNMLLGVFMASLAEAVNLGEKCGINRETVLDVLDKGAGKSLVLDAKKAKMLAEDFSPHFSVDAIFKDLNYLQGLASDMRTPLYSLSTVKEMFAEASMKGLGNDDFSALFKLLRDKEG